jgi:hypothetical protein
VNLRLCPEIPERDLNPLREAKMQTSILSSARRGRVIRPNPFDIPLAVFLNLLLTMFLASELGATFFDGRDLGNGWKKSSWYGEYYGPVNGWIFHADHGWQFPEDLNANSTWIYDSRKGWIWTKPNLYPFIFSNFMNRWLSYSDFSSGNGIFYDFQTSTWITGEKLEFWKKKGPADTGDTVDSSDQFSTFGYTATIDPKGTLVTTSKIRDIYEENFQDSSWYDLTIDDDGDGVFDGFNSWPLKFNGIHLSNPLQIGPGMGTSSYAEKNPGLPGQANGHNKVFLNGAELRLVFKPRKATMGWDHVVSSSLFNCATAGFWQKILFKHINVYKNYVLQKPDSYNQFNGTGTASVSGTTVTLAGLGALDAAHMFAPGWKIRFHNGDERTVTVVYAGDQIEIDSAPSGTFNNGNSYHILVKLGSPDPDFTWGYIDILDALPAFLSAKTDSPPYTVTLSSASNWTKSFWPNYQNAVYSPWDGWTSSSYAIGSPKNLRNKNGPTFMYQHTQRGAPITVDFDPASHSHDANSLTNEHYCWVDDGTGEWAFLLAQYGIENLELPMIEDDSGNFFWGSYQERGDFHPTKNLEFEITVWETDETVTPGDVFSVTYQQAFDIDDGAGSFGAGGTPTTWNQEADWGIHGSQQLDWFDPCYEQVFLRLIAK